MPGTYKPLAKMYKPLVNKYKPLINVSRLGIILWCHLLVRPLVLPTYSKTILKINRLSARCKRCHLLFLYKVKVGNDSTVYSESYMKDKSHPQVTYAREVLVYKRKKQISITRKSLEDTNFFRTFIRRYAK